VDDLEIRLATPADLPVLPAIEETACGLFEEIPATAALPLVLMPEEDFETAQRQGRLWVATVSDLPVGFALVELVDGLAHLEELDVLPAHGRRGIGTRLVRAVCDWARDTGLPGVTLCTFRDVPWNAPFYERLGFRVLAPEALSSGLAERVRKEETHGLPREIRVTMRFDPA
jgi:GNAT superfamily N-acetyltransferase